MSNIDTKAPAIGSHIDLYMGDNKTTIVYNRDTKVTYTIGEKESTVLRCLTGLYTMSEIKDSCSFYSTDEIDQLMSEFERIGLFSKKSHRFNPFKIQISLFNPNRVFTNSRALRLVYPITMFVFFIAFVMGLIMYKSVPHNVIVAGIPNISTIPIHTSILSICIDFIIILFSVAIHELSHTISARRYDVNVPEIGVMLYLLIPIAYVNISGINLLENKVKRFAVLFSGTIANLGLIGICYSVVTFTRSPIVQTNSFIIIIANVIMIAWNMLIFVKMDGYYIFENLMDEPGFCENAFSALKLIFNKNAQNDYEQGTFIKNVCYVVYCVLSATLIPVIVIGELIDILSLVF